MPRPGTAERVDPLYKEISWTAVFAGAIVAIGLGFLIHSMNLGIGLSTFTTNPTGAMVLAIGGTLWLILCTIVTMFVSGWVAGKVAAGYIVRPLQGLLHGFLAWSLALIFAVGIMTSLAGGIIGAQAANPYSAGHGVDKVHVMFNDQGTHRPVASKETEQVANTLGATALATFLVFLFGAISASIGGYYGSRDTRL